MARNGSKSLKSTTSLEALIRLSPDFQGLPSPWNHSKTLKMTYSYLKHPWIHQKCTLNSSEGSTAQNHQKGVKMAEIRCFKQNFTNCRQIGNCAWATAFPNTLDVPQTQTLGVCATGGCVLQKSLRSAPSQSSSFGSRGPEPKINPKISKKTAFRLHLGGKNASSDAKLISKRSHFFSFGSNTLKIS